MDLGELPTQNPVRVLIVDDTHSMRQVIRSSLVGDPRINVVGDANNSSEALEKIRTLAPDILTLDVEMPGMNGLVFLERLMRSRPMPVVMVSSKMSLRSEEYMKARSLGAIDCIDTRSLMSRSQDAVSLADVLAAAVNSDSKNAPTRRRARANSVSPAFSWNGRIVVIGSSTGGVESVPKLLGALPGNAPPIVLAQHMPPAFLIRFADRLDRCSSLRVQLAKDGDYIRQGQVLVAPGGKSDIEVQNQVHPHVRVGPAKEQTRHRPSIDALFNSCVPMASSYVAVLLSGMGTDGADSMLKLRCAGAKTIVQSPASSLVPGMPQAAIDFGGAEEVVPLDEIAERIVQVCQGAGPDA